MLLGALERPEVRASDDGADRIAGVRRERLDARVERDHTITRLGDAARGDHCRVFEAHGAFLRRPNVAEDHGARGDAVPARLPQTVVRRRRE